MQLINLSLVILALGLASSTMAAPIPVPGTGHDLLHHVSKEIVQVSSKKHGETTTAPPSEPPLELQRKVKRSNLARRQALYDSPQIAKRAPKDNDRHYRAINKRARPDPHANRGVYKRSPQDETTPQINEEPTHGLHPEHHHHHHHPMVKRDHDHDHDHEHEHKHEHLHEFKKLFDKRSPGSPEEKEEHEGKEHEGKEHEEKDKVEAHRAPVEKPTHLSHLQAILRRSPEDPEHEHGDVHVHHPHTIPATPAAPVVPA